MLPIRLRCHRFLFIFIAVSKLSHISLLIEPSIAIFTSFKPTTSEEFGAVGRWLSEFRYGDSAFYLESIRILTNNAI